MNFEAYVMNPDGSDQTRVTYDDAQDMFPTLFYTAVEN
jgi:hypothetical protein